MNYETRVSASFGKPSISLNTPQKMLNLIVKEYLISILHIEVIDMQLT